MAVQETTNVATIATRACSPDHQDDSLYGRALDVTASVSDEEFEVVAKDKRQRRGGRKQELKENAHVIPDGSLRLATDKPEESCKKITGKMDKDSTDDLSDIYISNEVLKQLRSQTDDKKKKSVKQIQRKQTKSQRKTGKMANLNNKEETDRNNEEQAKKILKPSLHRKNNLSVSRSQFVKSGNPMEILSNSQENVGNKAENNNWMVDDEKSTNMHNTVVLQHFHPSSKNVAYVDNIIEPSENMCRIGSLKNCMAQNILQSVDETLDLVPTKELRRADASYDSGCFSNVSAQSISPSGGDRLEINFTGYSPAPSGESRAASVDAQVSTSSSGLCSACGHEPHGNGSGLCKTCIGRIRHDGVRIGALGELRAYAQSIADSVKKILSISPRQSEAVLHPSKSTEGEVEGKTKTRPGEIVNATNNTCAQLHKCKTQITMTHNENEKAVNRLNKSLSFDGRAGGQLDDSCRGSPVYWITHDKPGLPISSSTLSELDDGKGRGSLENASDHSVIDGDYFPSGGKETKRYSGHDDGDGSSMAERGRRKNYAKQMSCLERMRPEGDNRNTYSQVAAPDRKGAADDSRRVFELHRGKSQIYRSANMTTENTDKSSQEEEMKALNVFRLKVIHEGSPVDPLYTVQRGKCEDARDRRAAFMRSATAPNKNHMPKKDGSMDDKSGLTRGTARAKKVNTKLDMKVNRSPLSQIKEISMDTVQEKSQSIYKIELENWRDDNSVMAVTPFTRRRSTSYDGVRRAISFKRNDKHRSASRPAGDRDDKGEKQRRHATPADKRSVKMNTAKEIGYKGKIERTLRLTNRYKDDNHTNAGAPVHSEAKMGNFTGLHRYDSLELSDIDPRLESPSKSYFSDDKYYCHQTENQFSTAQQELIIQQQNSTALGTDNYYGEIDKFDSGNQLVSGHQLVSEKALRFEPEDSSMSKTADDDDDSYHKQIQTYNTGDVSQGKESLWYNARSERRDVSGRDRSHESKSSTSFHIATRARSSHSDVAVMKHQNRWEHATSRRQQMYSETDVDTGLIYHFAKRQTTRAHVPAYHELTSSSKDIYTMSGDVSTPASSNSAISTKSEVSDSAYTGGFFKHDPFYDNDTMVSNSSSSAGFPDELYFEPSSATKREPSEVDIYTGAIFSSSQNALSLGRATEGAKTPSLKNGSTNNSTRAPLSRVSRRLRHKPHIDVIQFQMAESTDELFTKCAQPNSEIPVIDMSNNSSNWVAGNEIKDYVYEGASVSESKEPSYTEYKSSLKPAFHVKTIEKAAPAVNLMGYDNTVMSNNNFFYTAPSQSSVVSDSIWYSGLNDNIEDESSQRQGTVPDQTVAHASYSWQRNDDYYRSTQRPVINKTNNCSNCEQPSCNTNNNRFEDIYTGFFEAPPPKSCIPEPASNCRKTTSDNWYLEQPKRNYSSPDFYDEDVSISEPPKRTSTAGYESTEGAYSSASVFGQASAAYSGSRTYMNQSSWSEYDKMDSSSSNNYVDESPKFRHSTSEPPTKSEKYSYFQYLSSQSPDESTYRYDKGAYGFDQRTPSPEEDLNEIRKVGGIVCRENVVNREDYAEDVNRDLEQGAWMPFNFRHEEKARHQDESNSNRAEALSEILKVPVVVGNDKHSKHPEESSYNQDRIYDNVGARNKWREMTTKGQTSVVKKREASPHKAHSAGDTKRQEYVKSGAWNPPDQIPDRARGKRPAPTTPKPTVLEGSKAGTTTSNVISSVTSIPSRLTSYVKRWF